MTTYTYKQSYSTPNEDVKRYNSTAKEISDTFPHGVHFEFSGMERHTAGEYVLYSDYKWMCDYADRLVEHGNLPCLPADLDNLRKANAALATEVHEMKKIIKERDRFFPAGR